MNISELSQIYDWITANPVLTYIIVFLLSLSESLVVVGLIVPGIAIMTIIGTLVGKEILAFWPTFIASILGAIVGDGISYWIGQKFQDHIRSWRIFRRYPELITRCENFFKRHGGKSVVFGRFVGPVRPMIPAVAGMLKMPPIYFYFVNITSAFLWAPVYLFPGIIFGNTLNKLPGEVSKKIIILAALAFTAIWVITKIIKAVIRSGKKRFRKYGYKVLVYAEKNSLGFLERLLHHPLSHQKHQADTFLLLLFLFLTTCIYTICTNFKYFTTGLNALFKQLALIFYSTKFNHLLLTLDSGISLIPILVIFLCLSFCFLFIAKSPLIQYKLFTNSHNDYYTSTLKRTSLLTMLLVVSYLAVVYSLNYFIQYPGPFIINNYNYSFPSFNMGVVTLLLGYLAIIRYCNAPREYKQTSYSLYSISTLILVFIVKLYISHSWLSDLIGSILISSCILLAFCIIYWQKPLININHKNYNILLSFIIFPIILASSYIFYLGNKSNNFKNFDIKQAAISHQYQDISINTWLTNNFFEDLNDQVINIQWLGDKDKIINNLKSQEWYQQPKLSLDSALKLFINNPDITKLPLIPSFYQDSDAGITLSKKYSNNKILNLRLWQSEYKINNESLWIGTVQYLKPKVFFKQVTLLNHWPRAEFGDAMKKFELELKEVKINNKNIRLTKNIANHQLVDGEFTILYIN